MSPRPRSRRPAIVLGIALAIAGCHRDRAATVSPAARTPSIATPAPAPVAPPAPTRVARIDASLPEGVWPTSEPEAAGLDTAIVDAMIREAEASGSDSLLVLVDGKTVVERYFGRPRAPIETMSVTKSVVSLAIGMLLADGKIRSLDAPLSTWFPTWRRGRKAKVTLRHLLTHTSGIEHRAGAGVLNREQDRLAFVLASPVAEAPGTVFSYNNEAVQLLAAIVESAAGMPLDRYLDARLFAPLGITEWSWEKDGAGNVQAYYGLALHARDLAKIGQLMLDGGVALGRAVVPPEWIAQATVEQFPRSGHGFLWWLRRTTPRLAMQPTDLDTLSRHVSTDEMADLVGVPFMGAPALWLALAARTSDRDREVLAELAAGGLRPFTETPGVALGFAADGWLGQQLLIVPERKIVVVRQHRAPTDVEANEAYNAAHGFFGLARWIELASEPPR